MIHDNFIVSFAPIPKTAMRDKSKAVFDNMEAKGFQFSFSANKHYGTTSPKFKLLEYGLLEALTDDQLDELKNVLDAVDRRKSEIKKMTPAFLSVFETISRKSSSHYLDGSAYSSMITETFDICSILDDDWPITENKRVFLLPYIRFLCEYFNKMDSAISQHERKAANAFSSKLFDSIGDFIARNYQDLILLKNASMQLGGRYDLLSAFSMSIKFASIELAEAAKNSGYAKAEMNEFKHAFGAAKYTGGIMSTDAYSTIINDFLGLRSNDAKAKAEDIIDLVPDDSKIQVFGYDVLKGKITDSMRNEILFRYYTDKLDPNSCETKAGRMTTSGDAQITLTSADMIMDLNLPYMKSVDQKTIGLLDESSVMKMYDNGCILDWKRLFKSIEFSMETLMSDKMSKITSEFLTYIYSSQKLTAEFCRKYPLRADLAKTYLSKNKKISDPEVIRMYENSINWDAYAECVSDSKILDEFYANFNFYAIGNRVPNAIEGMRNKDALCFIILKYADSESIVKHAHAAMCGMSAEELNEKKGN